jgi:crotonobetainyl-CoA:carnitine CoA-transferase CaiB-like acyl-CoA transferase
MEGTEPVMAPIPDVGEHTDDILAELGYDEDDVSTLRSSSAV